MKTAKDILLPIGLLFLLSCAAVASGLFLVMWSR